MYIQLPGPWFFDFRPFWIVFLPLLAILIGVGCVLIKDALAARRRDRRDQ